MTVQHFTEEPENGTILADRELDEVWSRDDKAATEAGWGAAHWYSADTDEDPMTWEELNTPESEWQRLYRQSDVDAALAHQREQIAEALLAAGRDPLQNLAWMYPEQAADIARKHREAK